MAKKHRLALIQTAIGDYRQSVLEELKSSPDVDFQVYAGSVYFDGTTFTRVDVEDLHHVTNHFLLGRRLLWQQGHWRGLLSADTALIEYNPRILSNWVLLALRKALGRRNAVWGHAWPRAGRDAKTLPARAWMAKLTDCIVVYTESQRDELAEVLPGKPIIAAPNALYRAYQMKTAHSDSPPRDFIYVGRLVEAKKPDLMIKAFAKALPNLPPESKLIIVGDGPIRAKLEQEGSALGGRVEFKGHINDWTILKDLYSRSIASISPGYVGLSITQSFSFGVPMIIAQDEPHAPEIEAAVPGENCLMFKEDDPGSLADSMVSMWEDYDLWAARRDSITEDCRRRYSVEVMAQGLLASTGLTRNARPDRRLTPALEPVRTAFRTLRNLRHKARLRDKLRFGRNVTIGKRAYLNPPGFITLGENISIGADFHLESNLEAGSDILISSRVAFVGDDHRFDDPTSSVYWSGRNEPATVVLEGDNLIGFGVTVIGNVRIGRGCIVGSRAVVTADLPPNTVCVGVPARPIRDRYPVADIVVSKTAGAAA
jgi:acetyltransferase-like isoleucine patch superfamily enzyme/glycosyltransferase involved in cell wall biosynthesis